MDRHAHPTSLLLLLQCSVSSEVDKLTHFAQRKHDMPIFQLVLDGHAHSAILLLPLQCYVSSEVDKAQVAASGGNQSQGAIYRLQDGLGRQVLSTKNSASASRFGTSKRCCSCS